MIITTPIRIRRLNMSSNRDYDSDNKDEEQWLSDPDVIDAAKYGNMRHIEFELSEKHGFKHEREIILARAARKVMRIHGPKSGK